MERSYPSSAELEAYIARARQERALALQGLLRGAARLVARAFRPLRDVGAAIGRRRRQRAALGELRALDDRMLKDIGLSRGDIAYLADRYAETGRPAVRTAAGIVAQEEAATPHVAPAPLVPLPDEGPAHALRTPLTSIRSFAEILRDNPDLPQARRDAFLDGLLGESERLERAIDRVVDDRHAA